jgi:cysteinyl-tRNA synthetase
MVRFGGRKMSKSLGNLVDVGQTLERASPAAVRLYLLSHRYRRDWSFTWSGLGRAERLVARLRRAEVQVGRLGAGAGPARVEEERGGWAGEPAGAEELCREFKAALRTDLDTPAAIRVLRRAVAQGERAAAGWMLGILVGTAALG